MKTRVSRGKWALIVVALLTALFIAACGGGGGSAGGGIGGTGKAIGAIDGFGSIFVNGVEFEVDDVLTAITVDDQAGTEGELKLGMIVRVEGEFNDDGLSGFADVVIYDDDLEGPVSSIDTNLKQITIIGIEVVYNASTIFYDDIADMSITISGISSGNVVEVSGLSDNNGIIHATRIEKKADSFPSSGVEIEVKGQVAFLDTTASTFQLVATPAVAFTVDYSGVTPDGSLANDAFVEVKSSAGFSGNELTASSVEVEDRLFLSGGELLEIEGYISAVTSSTDFTVGDVQVDATTAEFKNGTPADIAVNVEVEVEGFVEDRMGTKVLVADEVEFEVEDELEIDAPLQGIDNSSNILTVLGIAIAYDDNLSVTEFEDKSGSPPITSVDDLSVNGWLSIRANLEDMATPFAERIELDDDKYDLSRIIVDGPASNIVGTSFDIVGVPIGISGSTGYRADVSDGPDKVITQGEFFAALYEGRPVKARGSFIAGTLIADELELQD